MNVLRLVCLLFGLLMASQSKSIGLGPIKIFSYLNEPLDAEIELHADPNRTDKLLISIAPQAEFDHINIPRSPILDKLSFHILRDEDELFISATSTEPITDPYLDFLLELSLDASQLIRHYIVLLDPIPIGGKPVYARRRQLPNVVEQPTTVSYAKAQAAIPAGALSSGLSLQPPSPKPATQLNVPEAAPPTTPSPEPEQALSIFNSELEPKPLGTVVGEISAMMVEGLDEPQTNPSQPHNKVPQATSTIALPPQAPVPPQPPHAASKHATALQPEPKSTLHPQQLEPNLSAPAHALSSPTAAVPHKRYLFVMGVLVLLVMVAGAKVYQRRRATAQRNAVKDALMQEREKDTAAPTAESPGTTTDIDKLLAEPLLSEMPSASIPTPPATPSATGSTTPTEETMVEEIEIGDLSKPAESISIESNEATLKLTLAKQYLDMGDILGAKDLLNSVLSSGDAAQKQEAENLLRNMIV